MGILVRRTGACSGCRSLQPQRHAWLALPAGITLAIAGLMTGCGSGGGMPAAQMPPPPPPLTAVTLVLSSTANDQLSQFDMALQAISLTSASGKQVSLLSQTRYSEFIHVNGTNEPLLTAMIPQDVYTAATVTVGFATFTCVTLTPQGMVIGTYAYGQTPASHVTVTLPSHIVVGGNVMGLSLNLMVSQSASYASCAASSPGAITPYAITPAFTLSAFAFPPSPATADTGSVMGLDGQVTALDSDSGGFQISLPASLLLPTVTSVHVAIDSATAWQGIGALTDLKPGTFVDLDGAIRGDGSVVATRVAVADLAAVDVQRGPLLFVSNAVPILDMLPRRAQGRDQPVDVETFNFNGSTFRVSGAFPNLGTLPFVPSFTAQDMVPGQAVYITSPAFVHTGSYFAVANTVTLVPQTVNGTVTGVTTTGAFTVYSVSLAPYELFSDLATQPGQTTLVSNPSAIEVYTDITTAMLTSLAPTPGDTLRFYGLVFNDRGTLRMDCAQVSAGATMLSQ